MELLTHIQLVSASYCFYDLAVLTLLDRPHQRRVVFYACMIATAPISDSARSSTLFNVPSCPCFCFRVSWVGLSDIIQDHPIRALVTKEEQQYANYIEVRSGSQPWLIYIKTANNSFFFFFLFFFFTSFSRKHS